MILFIDDEPFAVRYYLEELREGFGKQRVVYVNNLEEAQRVLNQNIQNIEIVILDIIMPPSRDWDKELVGLDAGIKFLMDNINQVNTHNIPVMLLTNRSLPIISDEIQRIREKITARFEVRTKLDTPAWRLPDYVTIMIR